MHASWRFAPNRGLQCRGFTNSEWLSQKTQYVKWARTSAAYTAHITNPRPRASVAPILSIFNGEIRAVSRLHLYPWSPESFPRKTSPRVVQHLLIRQLYAVTRKVLYN